MEQTTTQKRVIHNKHMGISIIKGKSSTGKTTTALSRMINLENNYCFYEEDKILYVSGKGYLDNVIKEYEDLKEANLFYSLFSTNEEKVDFISAKTIKDRNSDFEIDKSLLINSEEITLLILQLKSSSKFLKEMKLDFLVNEINWIKSWDFSLEEYLIVNRVKGQLTLRKNSNARKIIYDIYGKLKAHQNIDYPNNLLKRYTHIIIDDAELLTYVDIRNILKSLRDMSHSSIILIYNNENIQHKLGKIVSINKTDQIFGQCKIRKFLLKRQFKKEQNMDLDNFQYINFSHKSQFQFQIDSSWANKEIIYDEDKSFEEDELRSVPVFSNIAAGAPIEINEDESEEFYLPKLWVRSGVDAFILHVKGDSMTDKNINDGDMIVIQRQGTAKDNDIVAASVDGEATLKILKTKGKSPLLVPANSKYEPISLVNRDVHIFGVAIGVIKKF